MTDDGSTVTVGARRFPVRVVAETTNRVELEIAGERVVVDRWPDRYPSPPEPVEVDGERFTVRVEVTAAGGTPAPRSLSVPPAVAEPPPSHGVPVAPPMPGKVVELRVAEGDRVTKGQLLLVLEAMKMRNEIASPADGIVRRLAIAAGANVRARVPMLYVEPAPPTAG